MILNVELSKAQREFVNDLTTPEIMLVGGLGSGKSYAGAIKCLMLAYANPGGTGIVAAPTFRVAKNSIVKSLQDLFGEHGVPHKFHKSDFEFYIYVGGGKTSVIKVLSAENWTRLIGINAAWVLFDEIDNMTTIEDCNEAWQKLKDRVRDPTAPYPQMCAVGTPEGLKWCYFHFQREPIEDEAKPIEQRKGYAKTRRLLRQSARQNPKLKQWYIDGLLKRYTEDQVRAYLDGEFVNLKRGSVYLSYNRELNRSSLTVNDIPATSPLTIGMDFNYNAMSVVTYAMSFEGPVIIDEIIGSKNTEQAITAIRERYANGQRQLIVVPDASSNTSAVGMGRTPSSMSVTDLAQLRAAGFTIKRFSSNPRIKDRVNSVNAMLCNSLGERRLKVNDQTAPLVARYLEEQPYGKDGSPEKDGKMDGPLDAMGYVIYAYWPLTSPMSPKIQLLS